MTTENENRTEQHNSSSEQYNRENRYNNDDYSRRPDYNSGYSVNHEGGERAHRPRIHAKGGERAYRSSYNNDNYNYGGQRTYGENRPYRPRMNNNQEGGYRNNYNRDNYGQQRPRFNPNYNSQSGDYNNERPRFTPRFNPNYDQQGGRYGNDRPAYGNRYQQGEERGNTYGYRNNNRYNEDRGNYSGGYRPRTNNYGNDNGYGRPQRNFRPRTSDYNPNAKYSKKKQIEYKELLTDPDAPIRLNKFLANAGICSRREADEFITAGVVSVNGVVVTELGTKVKRGDDIRFHEEPVNIEKKVYILLNKPKDCVTTSDDPQERKTVMHLVAGACRERIYPVGRLDRNTTGVLLLTNDGEMASKLTHPKFMKKKIYHVYCDKNVTKADLDKILTGIQLPDGEIHADAISYASDTDKSQVGIEIHSGRNRIVRRIFEALGYRVTKLDRVYFAGLTKKGLKRGDWRFLTEAEVNVLRMGAFE